MKPILFIILLISSIPLINTENALTFDKMMEEVKKINKMKTMAVAGGDNLTMLQCCRKAKEMKLTDCILVGNEQKIKTLAKDSNIDISDFKIINVKDVSKIGIKTSQLVRNGDADIFAKGSLDTESCLMAIFDRMYGFKKSEHVSGISLFEIPNYNKFLIFTDPHVIPYPTLNQKITLINNAVEFAQSIGIEKPKIAVVTANYKPNPKFRETVDAQRLTKMNDIGQIKGCIVDGPLSFDLAANPVVPKYKVENRKIKGDADIILFPNIHSANIAYNLMIHGIHAKSGTLLTGTKSAVVFTSRAASMEEKLYSVVLAIFHSEHLQKNKYN